MELNEFMDILDKHFEENKDFISAMMKEKTGSTKNKNKKSN